MQLKNRNFAAKIREHLLLMRIFRTNMSMLIEGKAGEVLYRIARVHWFSGFLQR